MTRSSCLLLGVIALVACRPHARQTESPVAFATTTPAHAPAEEVDGLAALAKAGADGRAARLERLLDLLDAARFGEDADTRDVLWAALGGHATGRGPDATREALTRLMTEATTLADLELGQDARSFVHDAIALLAADLQTPDHADGLAVRTLAYRTLIETGHPRIRDNARWRLFDHVRGTVAAALTQPFDRRMAIAIQAAYAAREDLTAELADGDPHERPRWEGPDEIVRLLEQHRAALAADPAWAPVLAAREEPDRELALALRTTLPASRSAALAGPVRPRGTGQPESFAPILHVAKGRVDVDAGRPQMRSLPLDDDDVTALAAAIRDASVQDGRGVWVLMAEPGVPSDELHRVLRALRRAQAVRVELAVLEPHAHGGMVLMQVPLDVVSPTSGGTTAAALVQARIHAHVDGRGLALAVDGHALERGDRLAAVRQAFPRERVVTLTIGPDADATTLVDTAIALGGGEAPRFAVIGWAQDAAAGSATETKTGERILAERGSWARLGRVVIDQPFPLVADDQQRLERFSTALPRCLPELGPRGAGVDEVAVALTVQDGVVADIATPTVRGAKPAAVRSFVACLRDEAFALRLVGHRDKLAITLRAK